MTGWELVNCSEGKLHRGSIYSLMSRLEKGGFVESLEVPGADEGSMPRTKYRITQTGHRAHVESASGVRLFIKGLATAS